MEDIRNFVLPERGARGIQHALRRPVFAANNFAFDVYRSIHSERDMP
jgi:hypothetical protein